MFRQSILKPVINRPQIRFGFLQSGSTYSLIRYAFYSNAFCKVTYFTIGLRYQSYRFIVILYMDQLYIYNGVIFHGLN